MRIGRSISAFVYGAAFTVGSQLYVHSVAAFDDPPVPNNENHAAAAQKAKAPATEFPLASALLGNLSPEHMKSLGQMLEQDWKERPEWGDMAVAILQGDYMRNGAGWWKPGTKRYGWNWLQDRFDVNKNSRIDRDEWPTDFSNAERFFDRLDRNGDGQITSVDFDYSEPRNMNMAALKDMMSNQLFYRLDKDSNGRVTLDELAAFFAVADAEELGFITPEDLRRATDDPPRKPAENAGADNRTRVGPYAPPEALRMFFRGELGWLGSGPQLDDPAIDFTLPTHDGTATVKLSDSFGKRPVVLVFGSFT